MAIPPAASNAPSDAAGLVEVPPAASGPRSAVCSCRPPTASCAAPVRSRRLRVEHGFNIIQCVDDPNMQRSRSHRMTIRCASVVRFGGCRVHVRRTLWCARPALSFVGLSRTAPYLATSLADSSGARLVKSDAVCSGASDKSKALATCVWGVCVGAWERGCVGACV